MNDYPHLGHSGVSESVAAPLVTPASNIRRGEDLAETSARVYRERTNSTANARTQGHQGSAKNGQDLGVLILSKLYYIIVDA